MLSYVHRGVRRAGLSSVRRLQRGLRDGRISSSTLPS